MTTKREGATQRADRRGKPEGGTRTARRTDAPAVRTARKRGRTAPPVNRETRAPRTGPQSVTPSKSRARPTQAKSVTQARARAKARKAKAPKVVRASLRERLITRLAAIDLRPRTLAARVPFVVLIIAGLGVGLGVTLWLSTDAAERSYQLANMRAENRALLQQKEALERDVLTAQSAPALAEAARTLGMIPSRDTAHLIQDPSGNWVVVGSPKPADGVPAPALNTKLPDEQPAPPPPPAAPPPSVEVPVRVTPAPRVGTAPVLPGLWGLGAPGTLTGPRPGPASVLPPQPSAEQFGPAMTPEIQVGPDEPR